MDIDKIAAEAAQMVLHRIRAHIEAEIKVALMRVAVVSAGPVTGTGIWPGTWLTNEPPGIKPVDEWR